MAARRLDPAAVTLPPSLSLSRSVMFLLVFFHQTQRTVMAVRQPHVRQGPGGLSIKFYSLLSEATR